MGETKKRVTRRGPRPDDPGGVPVPPPAKVDEPSVPAAGPTPEADRLYPDRAACIVDQTRAITAKLEDVAYEVLQTLRNQEALYDRLERLSSEMAGVSASQVHTANVLESFDMHVRNLREEMYHALSILRPLCNASGTQPGGGTPPAA